MEIILRAGCHARMNCPVSVVLDGVELDKFKSIQTGEKK